ncbi:hypothetical protein K492DRAFT_204088 [Lichtheimia hyalospora FSU 10163]|nr:hypothetical protein K492DRAFT_204088 [Lichtheimia hyalospora FSU 10163]
MSEHPNPISTTQQSLSLPEHIGKRVDPAYSSVLHARVKEILHIHHDSFPGTQPVSFETKHLSELEREDYFVCEKTDGIRYLLFFVHSPKGPASFLFDRNKVWYYVPNLLFPVRSREKEYLKDTLMDGELVMEEDSHDKKTWRFLLFDLMAINGTPVTKRSFNTRLGVLRQEVIAPFNNSLRHITDPSKMPPFTIELKKMERSYGLHLVFEQMSKLKHCTDGVIWTPVKYPYMAGTSEKLLKWKPPEQNTVDFRISVRWSKEHKPIYSLEVLSHGVTYKFFDHFQPESSLAGEWKGHPPDGRIAEFRFDPDWEVTIVEQGYAPTTRKGGWRFVRFRTDKSTANDEGVVKKILNSIRDGITRDQLLAHMDRVRSAWKAREKGLPPPPHKPEALSLSTTSMKTNQPLATPTSSILPSPSVTNSSGYFPERSNSISSTSVLDRRRSEADVRSKSSQNATSTSAPAPAPSTSIQVNDSNGRKASVDSGMANKREASPKVSAMERKRFKSWAGEESLERIDEHQQQSSSSSPPSPHKSPRHHSPKYEQQQKHTEMHQAAQAAGERNGTTHKKKFKSPSPPSSSPTPPPPSTTSSNIQPSRTSSIHSLLTTSVDPVIQQQPPSSNLSPSPVTTSANPSTTIIASPPPTKRRAFDLATILHDDNHRKVPSEQQKMVQFINYHADGMHIQATSSPRNDSNEWTSSLAPSTLQYHQQSAISTTAVPAYHHQLHQQHTSSPMEPGGRQLSVWKVPQQQPPPPSSSSPASSSSDQKQKRSSKAMLDFILN